MDKKENISGKLNTNTEQLLQKEFSKKLLEKNFRISTVVTIFLVIQIFLLFVFLQNMEGSSVKNHEYPKNETELFLPISESAISYKEDSLPIISLMFLNDDFSIFEMWQKRKEFEINMDKTVVFCLEQVYERMPENILIHELYVPQQDEYLNSSSLGIESEKELDEYLKKLVGENNVYITHLTIQGEIEKILAVLKEEEVINVKIYAYNTSVAHVSKNLNVMSEAKGLIYVETFLCITLLISLWFYYRSGRREKRTIRLFYQYGFAKSDILVAVIKKTKIFRLFLWMLFINIGILAFMYFIKHVDLNYLLVEYVLVLIFAVILIIGENRIKYKEMKKPFSWRWR